MAERLTAGHGSKLLLVGNRLKEISVDPLERIGLPSKGDKSLLDLKAQESYYGKIVERYDRYCSTAGRSSTLDESLASLSLESIYSATGMTPLHQDAAGSGLKVHHHELNISNELSVLTMAMRKIREAIVATSRIDAFAIRAYNFIIRATILEKHPESYQPALLHLLRKLFNSPDVSASEKQEFIGYYILDLACRQGDLAEAFRARNIYDHKDIQVESVLRALVHWNWFTFWNIREQVNEYQKRLMGFGEDTMRKHAVNGLSRSYLNINRAYVEQATGRSWKELKELENLGWQQDGETIIIKQIKKK